VSEEDALWAAIGAMPEDALRRLVLADWYDERAGVVRCERCKGCVRVPCPSCIHWKGRVPKVCSCAGDRWVLCPTCNGTGTIPDGRADLAMALRATATYIPHAIGSGDSERWWYDRRNYDDDIPADEVPDHLPGDLFDAIQTDCEYIDSDMCIAFKRFPTASAAIMALGRAWVAVHCKSEVAA